MVGDRYPDFANFGRVTRRRFKRVQDFGHGDIRYLGINQR